MALDVKVANDDVAISKDSDDSSYLNMVFAL